MASQSVGEDFAPELDPPVIQRPVIEVTLESSPDQNVDSTEYLKIPGDEVVTPGPTVQEKLQPEDQSQPDTTTEGNPNQRSLLFPTKLWNIVNDETIMSVTWSHNGDTVVVEENMFQKEILNRSGKDKIFKMGRMKSFIRQLNRYGFRNIHPEHSGEQSEAKRRVLIYHNFNFQKNKPELLKNISRKYESRNPAQVRKSKAPRTSAAEQGPCSKKMRLSSTRRSPGVHKMEEDDRNSQQEVPNYQKPTGKHFFVSSRTRKMNKTPVSTLEYCSFCVRSGTCRKSTPRTVRIPPVAFGDRDGAGNVSCSSTGQVTYEHVLSLYNTCCSMLKAALSAIAQKADTDEQDLEEEEKEGEEKEEEEEEEEEMEEEKQDREGEEEIEEMEEEEEEGMEEEKEDREGEEVEEEEEEEEEMEEKKEDREGEEVEEEEEEDEEMEEEKEDREGEEEMEEMEEEEGMEEEKEDREGEEVEEEEEEEGEMEEEKEVRDGEEVEEEEEEEMEEEKKDREGEEVEEEKEDNEEEEVEEEEEKDEKKVEDQNKDKEDKEKSPENKYLFKDKIHQLTTKD